jgi:predicted ATPase
MQPGTRVADRWVIEGLADSGGMGSVYRAADSMTGATVALKVLDRGNRHSVERFRAEVDALVVGAEHDGIVRYVDHGVVDDATPFLVMEWIEGESLAHRLADRGVSMRELLALAARLADALSVIHSLGVVHRDVKPSNVMLPMRSLAAAKFVDFGLARVPSARMLTVSGIRMGTLEYMAPEQIRSARSVDGRADVFGLGCILFECATGRRPYAWGDEVTILARIVLEAAPLARVFRPEVPAALEAFVARLLERDPARRPTADAVKREIAALARQLEDTNLGPVSTARSPLSPEIVPTRLAGPVAALGSTVEWTPGTAGPVESPPIPATPAIPVPQGEIVGREADVRAASDELRRVGDVVVLWGAVGVGKTRLALEVARSLVPGTFAGAAYGDLREARDEESVLRAVCVALGVVPLGSIGGVDEAIGRALDARGRWLLVLDHVEAIPEVVTALVAQWRAAAPNACFLLVSRERLRAPGAAIELEPLAQDDAVRLFAKQAGVESTDARAHSIVRALDRNPLAIALAGARLDVLGLDGLVERLHRPLELLGSMGTREHPFSMREALEWSWMQLSDEEKRALACLSVFRGGFTARAAETVIGTPAALDSLKALREKSLLTARPSSTKDSGVPRLALSGAVGELASAKLDELGLGDGARSRHGEHYAAAGRKLAREVETTGSLGALEAIASEADNLLAAADHALAAGAAARALHALVAIDPVLATRGPFDRHAELLDAAIAQAERTDGVDARVVADAKHARGRLLATRGRFDAAAADFAAALDTARSRGDTEAQALVLLDAGVMRHRMQDLPAARAAYRGVLDLGIANIHAEARALANLGALSHDLRQFDQAYVLTVEAIALFESLGDQRFLGIALMNLAVHDQERKNFADAGLRFRRALGYLEAVRDRRRSGIAWSNLGTLELERGDWSAALGAQQRARALLAEVGDLRSEALCLGRLGAALACAGRTDEAAMALAKAERLAARRDPTAQGTVRVLRAFLDVARGRTAMAAGDTTSAIASADAADDRMREASVVTGSADGANESAPLADRSDDVRAALRVLAPMVSALRAELRGTP